MVVLDVECYFTLDIFSHLTLFHFISWLLRTALRHKGRHSEKEIYSTSSNQRSCYLDKGEGAII